MITDEIGILSVVETEDCFCISHGGAGEIIGQGQTKEAALISALDYYANRMEPLLHRQLHDLLVKVRGLKSGDAPLPEEVRGCKLQ